MESKKKPELDLRKKSSMFFEIGLAVSLGAMLIAFEANKSKADEIEALAVQYTDETETIPPIEQNQPPPPPPPERPPELTVVEDDEEIDTTNYADLNQDNQNNTPPPPPPPPPPPDNTGEREIFTVVEQMPEFPGGQKALDLFVRSNFQMPPAAADVGASGRIYIEFIVNTDGSVTDLKILKDGVGWGCGEEALRVVTLMAQKFKWTPGRQRNKPVAVRYRYPIDITQGG